MKRSTAFWMLLVLAVVISTAVFRNARAVESWTQTLMTDVAAGVAAKGNGVLQVGEVGTLSAAVTNTLTETNAAPSAGSIYLRGIYIEKMTATTGTVTVDYGTGTNCGTGTTTILTIGPQTASSPIPIGYYPVNVLVTAKKALCLVTDGAGTSARALAE